MRLTYSDAAGEKTIALPGGKAISGVYTDPGNGYFNVWLACRSLPARPTPYIFHADVSIALCYNVYKNGKAVSSVDRVFSTTPVTYRLTSKPNGG